MAETFVPWRLWQERMTGSDLPHRGISNPAPEQRRPRFSLPDTAQEAFRAFVLRRVKGWCQTKANQSRLALPSLASGGEKGRASLRDRSWFTTENIDVSTYDNKVTLTGFVDYWDERALAGTTAWAAPGLTSVTNDIRVH